jgi:glucose-6-phosphate 1-dehydrogenase
MAPATVVIFGSTGDLAKHKLLPALFNLAARGVLPDGFRVVGVGRRPLTDEAYREKVRDDIRDFCTSAPSGEKWEWFISRVSFAHSELAEPAHFAALAERLDQVQREPTTAASRPATSSAGARDRGIVFYLATPPDVFGPIVSGLHEAGLLAEHGGAWRRIIVEKPFGHDLASARALNAHLASLIGEHQVYRIDHYLGKETVQNLMAFRFANGVFEPIWNRRYVDHVQITVAETGGVGERGGYYDEAGALRDMVQNHLFQLLALTAMEPPISFRADDVRNERVKVLRAIRRGDESDVRRSVVRGQYVAAEVGGEQVPGYREESTVPHDSTTETFVALRLLVDNWRWADVPFYLRTGKRLPARASEVVVQFRRAPLQLFREATHDGLDPNLLIVRIQPNEGISLRFTAKVPGAEMKLGTVDMAFDYADYFSRQLATGYETLLYDAMTGDQSLFHRADMVETGWSVVKPLLELVGAQPAALLHDYRAGSWGPPAADVLLEQAGREWHDPTGG